MKIEMYGQDGVKVGTQELNSTLFEVPWKPDLVHRALLRQLAGNRHAIASTKTRGERRGGGKKPWKQKHTGRARVGSIRSPLWRKGGIIFGPRGIENHSLRMSHKERILALLSTLSQKARDDEIIGLDQFSLEQPKTKTFATLLAKLPVKRSCLVVIGMPNPTFQKSVRNIPSAKVIDAHYLNIADLLNFNTVLCTKDAFKALDDTWGTMAKQLSTARSRKPVEKKVKKTKQPAAK